MTAKTVAVGLAVVLMMVGGAAAVTAGPAAQSDAQTQAADTGMNADTTAPGDADIGATYDNGTVTVTATQGGEPVENASVELNEEEYTTGADGTVVAEYDGHASLEIEAETGGFEGEVRYTLVDDSLLIQEEEYEYTYGGAHEYEGEYEHEDENEQEEEHEDEDEPEHDDADEDEPEDDD